MSLYSDILAAVISINKELDNQIYVLSKYSISLGEVSTRIQQDLSGSNCKYEKDMMDQIRITKDHLEETARRLQNAKDTLNRWAMR